MKKYNEMNKNQFFDFDNVATNYRKIHNLNLKHTGADSEYFAEYKIKELMKYESEQTGIFLDFGCGDGISAVSLRKYFPQWKYFGIDISNKTIDFAKKRNITNAYFKKFDGVNIPYEPNSFDIVFAACVFHHIDFTYHKLIFNNIKNILKSGGRIYIFEHNPFNPITCRIVKDCVFDQDAALLKSNHIKKMLNFAGFRNVQTNYILFFPRTKVFKKLLVLEKYLIKMPIGGQYYIIGNK